MPSRKSEPLPAFIEGSLRTIEEFLLENQPTKAYRSLQYLKERLELEW